MGAEGGGGGARAVGAEGGGGALAASLPARALLETLPPDVVLQSPQRATTTLPPHTWALITMLSEPNFLASASASSGVKATPPLGVLTPCSRMMLADWYSCRFKLRTGTCAWKSQVRRKAGGPGCKGEVLSGKALPLSFGALRNTTGKHRTMADADVGC